MSLHCNNNQSTPPEHRTQGLTPSLILDGTAAGLQADQVDQGAEIVQAVSNDGTKDIAGPHHQGPQIEADQTGQDGVA